MYAVTEKGAFWYSENDGKTWQENSEGLPIAYIRSICPSRFKLSRVYVAMSGINYDDLNKYLFVSEDYGKTWKPITTNLPNEPVNVILEDPNYENILYTGAYRGVYISMDRGETWNLMGRNLPAASIGDLEIQEREKELVVGTHGRGIYYFNLIPIYELFKKGFPPTKNLLFNIPPAKLPRRRASHKDVEKSTIEKVPISFWSIQSGTAHIKVFEEPNQPIWQKELKVNRGFNQFRWDLVVEAVASDMPYFIHYEKYMEAGDYMVELDIGGEQLRGTLNVVKR